MTVGAIVLIVLIITVILVSIIIYLVRSRKLLLANLEHLESSITEAPAVYGEFGGVIPNPPSSINTELNPAYTSVSLP